MPLIPVLVLTGCLDVAVSDESDASAIAVPTDGTWDYENLSAFNATGFGEWSQDEEQEVFRTFIFLLDTPPTVTEDHGSLIVESEVRVRRTGAGFVPLALDDLHASFRPGIPIVDDAGNFNYDETYGRTSVTCEADEIEVGEETTCLLTYKETSHPEWLQNSYWSMHGTYMGMWPSQTSV